VADLFALLVQSGNSLAAHSGALATAGHNIANANTPGYSRQVANLVATQGLGQTGALSVGRGVSLESITRSRDQFIERQLPNALAAQASSNAESEALQAVSALNPDLQGGLPAALGEFYSSLRTVSQNPSDLAARQGVIGRSQALARSFNQTVGAIEDGRYGLDARILGKVDEINAAARSLASLNVQIQTSGAANGTPNDLLDARQKTIETLASLTGATPYTNNVGDVSMALPGGTVLVSDGRAAQVSAVPDPANGAHLTLRLTRPDHSGPVDVASASLGGEMGGLFGARDGAMKTAVDALDNFAFNLATSVNVIHQGGYAMDGSGLRDLFTISTAAAGAASQIGVNGAITADARLLAAATTLPAGTGDNRNILALIGTEQQALASGNDPIASLQKIITDFGTSSAQSAAFAAHDSAMAVHLTDLRDSSLGVSLDEEMINLTKSQKAYEALSKVIATADQMLDTLMSLR
jgi:flagellar hook-associated protein 1 FlgK